MKRGLQLLEFQQQGVKRILRGFCQDTYQAHENKTMRTRSFLLFDEMGLGKTIQALEALRRMLHQLTYPSLVIGPASCIHVWAEQVELYFKDVFEVRLFIGSTAAVKTMSNTTSRTLIVTSYDTLRNAYQAYISQTLPLGQLNNGELYRFCQVYLHHRYSPMLSSMQRSDLLKLAKQVQLKFASHTLNTKYAAYCALVRQVYSIVVMDEAHKLKNSESSTTKAVACILSSFRLALTGTPIMNNGRELLSIIRFGLGLFDADWNEMYHNPNGPYCRQLRSTVMLGRKKSHIPEIQRLLPLRRRELERVCIKWALFPEAARAYVHVKNASLAAYKEAHLLRKMVWETKEEFISRRTITTQSFWAKFQRLRQICLHPDLPRFQSDPYYGRDIPISLHFTQWTQFLFPSWVKQRCFPLLLVLYRKYPILYHNQKLRFQICNAFIQSQRYTIQPSAKMLAFYRIYVQTQRTNPDAKVVAVSHFRTFLERVLSPWLTTKGITNVVFAGGNRKKQIRALNQFKHQQDVRVLLIVKSAGAHGLNLQDTASTCVLFDPHFNEALDEQAVQRVDRIGQISDEVVIRKLAMEGSVDEVLYTMQEKKREQNNAWLGRNNGALSLEVVGMFLSKYDKVKIE